MAVDFVTVVDDDTVRWLPVQARSLARFLAPASVGTINILVNTFAPEPVYKFLLEEVVDHYGELKSRVEIYPISRFVRPHLNCADSVGGDAASLLISRMLNSSFFLLMRPGDHFIRASRPSDFGDQSSSRSRAARVEARASVVRKAAPSFELLDVPLPEVGAEFVADQLPFAFNVPATRAMIGDIETQYNSHLDDIFAKAGGAIRPVYLYIAFMMRASSDIRDVFKVGPRMTSGLKVVDDQNNIDAWLADADTRMLANVDSLRELAPDGEVDKKLAAFWVDKGLFDDLPAASIAIPRSETGRPGAISRL